MVSEVDKPVGEGPRISEETWQGATIASAVIALTIVFIYAFYTFSAASAEDMVRRSQAFTPFGATLIATVTFCAAMWRGMVTTRQANEQRRQNDANEEVNYGKVLQEGAKLIGQTDNEAHMLAGVASIETLLLDPKKRFSGIAMDLLANFVAQNYKNGSVNAVYTTAISALNRGSKNELKSAVAINFKTSDKIRAWQYVPGLSSCSFRGGTIFKRDFANVQEHYTPRFFGTHIESAEIEGRGSYEKCTFSHCTIKKITSFEAERNDFIECDFSGAELIYYDGFHDQFQFTPESRGNFYEFNRKPTMDGGTGIPTSLESVTSKEYAMRSAVPF
ncbi:hypothetical protein ACQZ4Q_01425 [Agrobacterium vitis]